MTDMGLLRSVNKSDPPTMADAYRELERVHQLAQQVSTLSNQLSEAAAKALASLEERARRSEP